VYKYKPISRALLFVTAMCVLAMGFIPTAVTGEDETEILNITVGKPTLLDNLEYQSYSSVSGSRTGIVAAFYPWKKVYRTSADGGVTWGPPMASPPQHGGGSTSGTLRDGGVIKYLTDADETIGEAEERVRPMVGEYKDGWFMLHSTFAWFNDDFTEYEVAPVQVYMPDAVTTKQTHLAMGSWPSFERGNMIQLDNGDLLTPLQGVFKGDTKGRTILCVSSDQGHKWRYYATVAVDPQDSSPELPGQYLGYAEPSIELLPDGQMICVMRTQYSHLPGEYRPLHVSWSSDLGKTWTKPIPTRPHLMNIAPKLIVLENGVVALEYGRPGFHVAFSLDNGHTWQDRVSFTHLSEPCITGQFDMAKAGPNKLVAIGSATGGTKVWPITVERVKVSPGEVALTGQVLDEQGKPIAGAMVERGPNRYTADDWPVIPGPESWGGVAQPHFAELMVAHESPTLAYRSIQEENGYPTVRSDVQGQFRFQSVQLGEYVLTVEAKGYAPHHRHIKVGPKPESRSQEFRLKAGRKVRGKVVDQAGESVAGACVGVGLWHCHTDSRGFFHWSVEGPPPEQVEIKVYKRYSDRYETLKTTVPFSQLESQSITLKNR